MWQEILSASGVLTMVAMLLSERDRQGGLFGLFTALVNRRSKITLERERDRNLRQILDQLPAGAEIMEQRFEPGRLHTIRIVAPGRPDQAGAQ